MLILRINEWYGRLGNNLLQLVRIIHSGIKHNALVVYPEHQLLKNTIFDFHDIKDTEIEIDFRDTFFNKNKYYTNDIHPYEYKTILDKYIYPIINLVSIPDEITPNKNDLVISVRSGDVVAPSFFKNKAHFPYIQPPISFYKTIIENNKFNRIFLVAEDRRNPIINLLIELYPNIITIINENDQNINVEKSAYTNQSTIYDLSLLLKAYNLVLPNGTWGTMIASLNKNIKNIYCTNFWFNDQNELIQFNNLSLCYQLTDCNIHTYNMKRYYDEAAKILPIDYRKGLELMIKS
jgi:hypothetical protein